MAFLIPENIRATSSVPAHHKRVATMFAVGADEATTVWYEPPFDAVGDRPHFVVLDPSLGVVVLEVLDQGARDAVLGVAQGEIRVRRDDREIAIENPWTTAERFATALRAAMAERPQLADVPVVPMVAATHLRGDDAERAGLGSLLDLDAVLWKNHHDPVLSEEGDATLLRQLARALAGGLDEPLDDDAVAELRGTIHPDTIIAPTAAPATGSLFSAAALDESDVMKVMDRRQERLAKGLGTGHRVIRGVAGSGKTLVLVHRARALARALPGKRILVTCYTRSLASQLRAQLADLPNVEVSNLYALMGKVVRRAGLEHPGPHGWDELPRIARRAVEGDEGPRYRAVMVDEAQDFDTDALAFCVGLLEATDAAEQDLVIVADSAQNIFRRDFRWKDAGISAQGRTRILRVNYRNTREILRFAHDFLTADPSIGVAEATELDDEMSIIPAESAERSGPEPRVHVVDAAAEVQAVVDQVRAWYRPDARPRSIAVLVNGRHHRHLGGPITGGLRDLDVPAFWVTDPDVAGNKDAAGAADEPVIVSTIQSAKGLEYPRVVVCGVGSAERATAGDLLADRKTLYVGFTRAIDELAVITTEDNAFAPDLVGTRTT